jgi:hypothetical protein
MQIMGGFVKFGIDQQWEQTIRVKMRMIKIIIKNIILIK